MLMVSSVSLNVFVVTSVLCASSVSFCGPSYIVTVAFFSADASLETLTFAVVLNVGACSPSPTVTFTGSRSSPFVTTVPFRFMYPARSSLTLILTVPFCLDT